MTSINVLLSYRATQVRFKVLASETLFRAYYFLAESTSNEMCDTVTVKCVKSPRETWDLVSGETYRCSISKNLSLLGATHPKFHPRSMYCSGIINQRDGYPKTIADSPETE